MFTRIVLPLDGSDLAAAASPTAEEIARLAGIPIHLVRVLDTGYLAKLAGYPVYGTFVEVSALMESLRNEESVAIAHLRAVMHELEGRGLRVTTELRRGHPAEEIVAATRPGDLVIMSTHGRGGLGRWFLGSIAEDVVRHATVPVTLVRTAAQAPREQTQARQEAPVREPIGVASVRVDPSGGEPATARSIGKETRMDTEAMKQAENKAFRLLHRDRYSPKDAAYLLGIPVDTIHHAAFFKELEAEIVGHDVISVSRDALLAWLNRDRTDVRKAR